MVPLRIGERHRWQPLYEPLRFGEAPETAASQIGATQAIRADEGHRMVLGALNELPRRRTQAAAVQVNVPPTVNTACTEMLRCSFTQP
jgi:hypothetical protein